MTDKEIIAIGRRVLEIESEALAALAPRIGESFARAVRLLAVSRARIIVTGMGKSGLVGRKIAATLASCGTPALFVHPAEAGHGDLGMILKNDVVLALSYSGETREIVGLLDFIKRIGVKLITVTGHPQAKIARHSDIVIDARVEREAEPAGLVPTASSTAALAVGDALAVALMKVKGFGERDFASVHPRGALGKKLLRVEAVMHRGKDIPRVRATTLMGRVVEVMSAKKLGMTCVLDSRGKLRGVITDGDLRRLLQKHGTRAMRLTADKGMTGNPVTISPNELATKALNLMEEKKITSLVVRNSRGGVDGVVHLHDLWRTEMF
ncbi:MAG: KpsF/GutQ family sugar-phosphate isomerase [Candidatus Aminicenantes bacterium]|nr:KpsF/GutQ family sugar-phosphate isomerase [Candidatus Aminicenantes bacterium]